MGVEVLEWRPEKPLGFSGFRDATRNEKRTKSWREGELCYKGPYDRSVRSRR